ncbi:vacuolar import and degradation protein 27 [Puccinia graminis f. sp. tritici]|uniref:Vacuolar import and degradation protein 27 n=1 Tax=Puccinia graminis f. sp. tritici TaxID=56615 RepID=A0A5B0MGK7_PUCGR|nr:vacuolar import and degradation protein 27 [Puccinia graminis f. sp. tritici]
MGTYGPGPSGFSSPSESDDESTTRDDDIENLRAEKDGKIAEKDNQIAELLHKVKQLEFEAPNKSQASLAPADGQLNLPAAAISGGSLTIAANQNQTFLNRPNPFLSSPANPFTNSSARSHQQSGVASETRYGPSQLLVERSSTTTTTSVRIASTGGAFSGSSSNGITHATIEYRAESSFTRWSGLKNSTMVPERHQDKSDRHFDNNVQVEVIEEEEGSSSDDEEDYEPRVSSRSRRNEPTNDHYAMGYKGVSCVVGGNTVKTFDDNSNGSGKLKLLAKIPGLKTPDGKRDLFPSKIMLHREDSNLIIQDKRSANSLYNFDLEVGKVVEEFKLGRQGAPLEDFCPSLKFGQMTSETTFVGVSSDTLQTIDPRLNGYKAVTHHDYKTNPKFSCVVTTEFGWIAVGSHKGDIRLYDSITSYRAKTWFRGSHGPVLALDVSKNGAFLIATYQTYLVLYESGMGFIKSIANSPKGSGTRLQLTREHQMFIASENIPFVYTPATFNSDEHTAEKFISTSIGPYLIAFKLQSILAGKPEYDIKGFEETVVTDNFRFNNDQQIVVMTPSDVFVQKRNKLSRPHRQSLDSHRSSGHVRRIRPSI